jgi:hypothetical protein
MIGTVVNMSLAGRELTPQCRERPLFNGCNYSASRLSVEMRRILRGACDYTVGTIRMACDIHIEAVKTFSAPIVATEKASTRLSRSDGLSLPPTAAFGPEVR